MLLEFGRLGCPREGDDVADVGHAGDGKQNALDAKPSASIFPY